MLQLIAMDSPPEKMQIISYHPGAIFTDAAKSVGWKEDSFAWDHGTSPTPSFSCMGVSLLPLHDQKPAVKP